MSKKGPLLAVSAVCKQCGNQRAGRIDNTNSEFYCNLCWESYSKVPPQAIPAPTGDTEVPPAKVPGEGTITSTDTDHHAEEKGFFATVGNFASRAIGVFISKPVSTDDSHADWTNCPYAALEALVIRDIPRDGFDTQKVLVAAKPGLASGRPTPEAIANLVPLLTSVDRFLAGKISAIVAQACRADSAAEDIQCSALARWLDNSEKLKYYAAAELPSLLDLLPSFIVNRDRNTWRLIDAGADRVVDKNFSDCVECCLADSPRCDSTLLKLATQFYWRKAQFPKDMRERLLKQKSTVKVWVRVLKHISEASQLNKFNVKLQHQDLRCWLEAQVRPINRDCIIIPSEHRAQLDIVLALTPGSSPHKLQHIPIRTVLENRAENWRLWALLDLGANPLNSVVEERIGMIEVWYNKQLHVAETLRNLFPRVKGPWEQQIPLDYMEDTFGSWSDPERQGLKRFPITFAASAVPDAAFALTISKVFVTQGLLKADDFIENIKHGVEKAVHLMHSKELLLREIVDLLSRPQDAAVVKTYLKGKKIDPDTLLWTYKTLAVSLDDTINDIAAHTIRSDPLLVALQSLSDKNMGLNTYETQVSPHLSTQIKEKLTHSFLLFLAKWLPDKEAQRRVAAVNASQVMFLPEQARQHAAFGVHATVVDHFCYLYEFVRPFHNVSNLSEILRKAKVLPADKDLRASLDSAMKNHKIIA